MVYLLSTLREGNIRSFLVLSHMHTVLQEYEKRYPYNVITSTYTDGFINLLHQEILEARNSLSEDSHLSVQKCFIHNLVYIFLHSLHSQIFSLLKWRHSQPLFLPYSSSAYKNQYYIFYFLYL